MKAIRPYVDAGGIPGAVVGVVREGKVSLEAVGATARGGGTAMTVDSLVRISSITKPIAVALALSLVEQGELALEDPVEQFVPELAGRHVLRRLDGRLDDTLPAERLVTVGTC